jgi:hypothetical protein
MDNAMTSEYTVVAYWGPRRENPEQCAARCQRMLEGLAAIDPAFGDWVFVVDEEPVPVGREPGGELVQIVADCVARADDGDPTPVMGFNLGGYARRKTALVSIGVLIHVGSAAPARNYMCNTVMLDMEPKNEGGFALITLDIVRRAVLAISAAWDATWCSAYPTALISLWTEQVPRRPTFKMAWISYLSARFAPLVTPPRSASSERVPGGGLLMIATPDRFDVADPTHLAVAREIEAALAPVNALPWPPDAEPP